MTEASPTLAQEFRRACGQFPTGVAIVAARLGDAVVGMTINSFASASLTPPLICWSLRNESRARAIFEQSGRFGVSILSADQSDLAARFARRAGGPDSGGADSGGPDCGGDPFAGVALARTDDPVAPPLIAGSLAQLDCDLFEQRPIGDHVMLVGLVRSFAQTQGAPLLFHAGRMIRVPHQPPQP